MSNNYVDRMTVRGVVYDIQDSEALHAPDGQVRTDALIFDGEKWTNQDGYGITLNNEIVLTVPDDPEEREALEKIEDYYTLYKVSDEIFTTDQLRNAYLVFDTETSWLPIDIFYLNKTYESSEVLKYCTGRSGRVFLISVKSNNPQEYPNTTKGTYISHFYTPYKIIAQASNEISDKYIRGKENSEIEQREKLTIEQEVDSHFKYGDSYKVAELPDIDFSSINSAVLKFDRSGMRYGHRSVLISSDIISDEYSIHDAEWYKMYLIVLQDNSSFDVKDGEGNVVFKVKNAKSGIYLFKNSVYFFCTSLYYAGDSNSEDTLIASWDCQPTIQNGTDYFVQRGSPRIGNLSSSGELSTVPLGTGRYVSVWGSDFRDAYDANKDHLGGYLYPQGEIRDLLLQFDSGGELIRHLLPKLGNIYGFLDDAEEGLMYIGENRLKHITTPTITIEDSQITWNENPTGIPGESLAEIQFDQYQANIIEADEVFLINAFLHSSTSPELLVKTVQYDDNTGESIKINLSNFSGLTSSFDNSLYNGADIYTIQYTVATKKANLVLYHLVNRVNAEVVNSLSMGRVENLLNAGEGSVALGEEVSATGEGSQAFGYKTKAWGNRSHAEGQYTTAYGDYSHSEGGFYQGTGSIQSVSSDGKTMVVSYNPNLNYEIREGDELLLPKGITVSSTRKASGSLKVGTGSGLDRASFSPMIVVSVTKNYSDNTQTVTLDDSTIASTTDAVTVITARGSFSHSEGLRSESYGHSSHAEGHKTRAIGAHAHSEGSESEARGYVSHSEGHKSFVGANASYAHAEGWISEAYGKGAHAENSSYAIGKYSHSEGWSVAWGVESHAEGNSGAIGNRGHAEGRYVVSGGESTHSEGYSTQALSNPVRISQNQIKINDSDYLLCVGDYIVVAYVLSSGEPPFSILKTSITAISDGEEYPSRIITLSDNLPTDSEIEVKLINTANLASHSEGIDTKSYGDGSHAEGKLNKVTGDYSHAEGENNLVVGESSHAEGEGNYVSGDCSHAEEADNVVLGDCSHAEGYISKAIGEACHAEGFGVVSGGRSSHSEGERVQLTNATYISSNQIQINDSAHIIEVGDWIVITCESPSDEWPYQYFTNRVSAITETEQYSVRILTLYSSLSNNSITQVELINTVSVATHSEGISTKAYKQGAHAEGSVTKASGSASHSEGTRNTASGNSSHSEGYTTLSSGDYSHAEGNSTYALGKSSHAEGKYSSAYGESSHAEGGNNLPLGTVTSVSYNSGVLTLTLAYEYGANIVFNGGEEVTVPRLVTQSDSVCFTVESASIASNVQTVIINTTHNDVVVGDELVVINAFGDNSHSEGYYTRALGGSSHSEGNKTVSAGSFSHAEGKETYAMGTGSHAEGYETVTSGTGAHAEGSNTEARGTSHAEGMHSIASATGAHAENASYAIGARSHSEGGTANSVGVIRDSIQSGTAMVITLNTPVHHSIEVGDKLIFTTSVVGGSGVVDFEVQTVTINTAEGIATVTLNRTITIESGYEVYVVNSAGSYSHSEGKETQAYGENSHSEGEQTKARGDNSHSEGLGTIAASNISHVQGKYNVADSNATFADIVGNGQSDASRSNASALDWNGNLYLKGKVYIECDSNSQNGRLAEPDYYIKSASVSGNTLTLIDKTNTPLEFTPAGMYIVNNELCMYDEEE